MKRKNDERGFGLIEVLVALAIFAILTALVGQSLVTIFQASHENNASAGVVDVMQAENLYKQLYGSFAVGSNAGSLSACPASGQPTATTACLTSKAFTNGSYYNQYLFSISQPADAGFLVIASPQNVYAGRLTYCGSATDPLVHGIVSKTIPSISTGSDCSALPALQQGAADNKTPPGYSKMASGSGVPYGSAATFTMTVPAGTYLIFAHAAFTVSNADHQLPYYYDANVSCQLSAPSVIDSGVSSVAVAPGSTAVSASQNMFMQGTMVSGTSITMTCANNAGLVEGVAHVLAGEPMAWTGVLTATPISTVVSQ